MHEVLSDTFWGGVWIQVAEDIVTVIRHQELIPSVFHSVKEALVHPIIEHLGKHGAWSKPWLDDVHDIRVE